MADEIRLSKNFIENELPTAPPLYVSVYLMTVAAGGTAAEVAAKLGVGNGCPLRMGLLEGQGISAGNRRKTDKTAAEIDRFPTP